MGELSIKTSTRAVPIIVNYCGISLVAQSLESNPVVEVTTFEKRAGAHVDENAQSFYSKKSLSGKHFLFVVKPA